MKILNLYAGIGGNRKLWGDEHEVTAIELEPEIAAIYQDFFPKDKVIVTDAHQYLLEHFKEFDFIWSSPPCPTHSKFMISKKTFPNWKMPYPDMSLYQEIIFLQSWFKGKFVVENVMSYYKPLIRPYELQRHYFWSNFPIPKEYFPADHIRDTTVKELEKHHGINLDGYKIDKSKVLSNCVNPKVALFIFNMAFKEKQSTL
ncbi:hypothetical protein LCGC14_0632770 [marine sediment metagenome]|uniref:DNA (cytosine-5-)-methyltransferase n=1 Tax=marine sediment metagenome TaxID=412755 RepID=A0A0F9TMY7_9ZZZZ